VEAGAGLDDGDGLLAGDGEEVIALEDSARLALASPEPPPQPTMARQATASNTAMTPLLNCRFMRLSPSIQDRTLA